MCKRVLSEQVSYLLVHVKCRIFSLPVLKCKVDVIKWILELKVKTTGQFGGSIPTDVSKSTGRMSNTVALNKGRGCEAFGLRSRTLQQHAYSNNVEKIHLQKTENVQIKNFIF